MSYDWFNEVLDVLGEVVNYTAIVNYAGNAFCEKSWDMILDSNPMLKGQILTADQRAWQQFFATAQYTIKGAKHGKADKHDGQNSDNQGQNPVPAES